MRIAHRPHVPPAPDVARVTARGLAATLLAVTLGCGGDAPTPPVEQPAYDPSIAGTTGSIYHWASGQTIRFFVDTINAPAGSDLHAAVRAGASAWAQAVGNNGVRTAIVTVPTSADVLVRYSVTPRRVGSGGCTSQPNTGSGVTFFCLDGNAVAVLPLLDASAGEGRIKMDVIVNRARVPSEERFAAVVAHELGHVFGIGRHSSVTSDLMHAGVTVDAPSADDGRTLRWVLRQPATVVP